MTDVFGDELFCVDEALVNPSALVVYLENRTPSLILYAPTGVWYTSQTNGMACRHPVVEGFAIPLTMETPPHNLGGCWEGIPDELADWIDTHAYVEIDGEVMVKVDRERISNEYGEAWVPIITNTGLRGVLTYENCD